MGSQRKQVFSRVSFLEVFWPNIERQIWGFSSSSCSWRRARVYAQHSRHCDPRSTVQLRSRTSVLRLILTPAHQPTSCPYYPKPGPIPLHVPGRLIRRIVGLTLAVNLGGRARALSHLRVPIAASLYSLRSTLGVGPGLYASMIDAYEQQKQPCGRPRPLLAVALASVSRSSFPGPLVHSRGDPCGRPFGCYNR